MVKAVEFSWIPEPREIPKELSNLKPTHRVCSITYLQNGQSRYSCDATDLIADIQNRIDLQARGRYTLAEIAAVLATANNIDAHALNERFTQAAKNRELTVRNPDTGGAPIAEGERVLLYLCWVFPKDINDLLTRWQVPYRFEWPRPWQLPVFTLPTQLEHVPSELKQLSADARVLLKTQGIKISTDGKGCASEVIEIFEGVIKRQREGYFTVDEAAKILTAASGDFAEPHFFKAALKRMLAAHKSGSLTIRECGLHHPINRDERVTSFQDVVKFEEMNAWLESDGASYRFPARALPLDGNPPANVKSNSSQWTKTRLAELEAFRAGHTMPETAIQFGISQQRIRQLLPRKAPKNQSNSVFTHRAK